MNEQVYILDKNLNLRGVVDGYNSLIWASRYREIGDCELYVPATPEMLALCQKGFYIARDGDPMICQIRKIELDTDAEAGNYIIATGYDAKILLDQRVVWTTMTANGNAERFARKMVVGALGADAGEGRQLTDSDGRLIFGLGAESGLTDRLSEQVSYKNVGEKIREYCLKFGWGYRMTLDEETRTLLFSLYKGADRTESVIFSDEYENLAATKYIEDETKMGNVAMVAGEGQGSDRQRAIIGSFSGAERFEIYVDARDLSQKITFGELTEIYPPEESGGYGRIVPDGDGWVYRVSMIDIQIVDAWHLTWLEVNYPGGTVVTVDGTAYYRMTDLIVADLPGQTPEAEETVELRDVVYLPYLLSRGYEQMAQFGAVRSFEGTIEPNTTFIYGRDYHLGDIVTVQSAFGISVSVRIVEVVEVWDDSGYNVEPKFEYITEV